MSDDILLFNDRNLLSKDRHRILAANYAILCLLETPEYGGNFRGTWKELLNECKEPAREYSNCSGKKLSNKTAISWLTQQPLDFEDTQRILEKFQKDIRYIVRYQNNEKYSLSDKDDTVHFQIRSGK